ncbi:hypothetical protein PVAP13_9NG470000 [Panicum virgatum]|uniref:Uncharacterized protein n=1 Tax=Panicum virgatum TaxID=38727 RepID=A0A8T0MQV7_PANVG|nr:hypothetical protein PVAP13_9NG470000 [Panicum virgatum]
MDLEMNLIFLFFLMCWFFIQVRLMDGCSIVWVLHLYKGDERWQHRRDETWAPNSNFVFVVAGFSPEVSRS